MIDETKAHAHAGALVDRIRRQGFPMERARSLACADLRALLTSEVDEVLENVASLLEKAP